MSGPFEPHFDLIFGVVAAAPSPNPTTSLTLSLQTGQGSSFPAPSTYGSYQVLVGPNNAQPTPANSEKPRITGIAGDVLTITRGSPARSIQVGDLVVLTPMAKHWIDVEKIATVGATVSTTGNITALAIPAGFGTLLTRMTNSSLATIQGMTAGLYVGQKWRVTSDGTGQVNISHHSGSATGAQCTNFATSGDTPLAPGVGVAEFQWDGTFWRMTHHEQGAWLTPTFSAGNFTGNVSMTLTVTSPQVAMYQYYLRARTLMLAFDIGASSVGGTPSTALQIAIPGGFTVSVRASGTFAFSNNGSGGCGFLFANTGGALLQLFLDRAISANWSLATTNTVVSGTATFGVN